MQKCFAIFAHVPVPALSPAPGSGRSRRGRGRPPVTFGPCYLSTHSLQATSNVTVLDTAVNKMKQREAAMCPLSTSLGHSILVALALALHSGTIYFFQAQNMRWELLRYTLASVHPNCSKCSTNIPHGGVLFIDQRNTPTNPLYFLGPLQMHSPDRKYEIWVCNQHLKQFWYL